MSKTKIIATLGPACNNAKTLAQMIDAGMFAARFNFSHGDHKEHEARFKLLKKAEGKSGWHVKTIQDLSGPKLRMGSFGDRTLKEGQIVKLGGHGIPVEKPIWKWVKKGQVVLVDDGVLELVVVKKGKDFIDCRVIVGGLLKPRKGVSLPGVKVELPSLSGKDIEDLKFGIELGMDAVAISFIRSAQDIRELRKFCTQFGQPDHFIIAKIETVEAVANIRTIIKEADAIMIARGDLALNLNMETVPLYQKKITQLCHEFDVPVIIATQMLDSMTHNPRPTRAEMSDVANAVLDSADAVMLSGETANGKYPVKTVQTMNRIIELIEKGKINWNKWMRAKKTAKHKTKTRIF